jgi:hypothetical protein
MPEYLQLDQLAPSKLSNLLSTQRNTSALKMEETDSRVPLLVSPTTSTYLEEGRGSPSGYGTSAYKDTVVLIVTTENDDEGGDDGEESTTQGGVQQADAINLVWSRAALILAYFL